MALKLRYEHDEDTESPRTSQDNFGTMVCFHKRYTLGDKTELRSDDFSDFDELRDHLVKKCQAEVILPLYLLDHSGLAISVEDFGDVWDSGQIGFIYCTKKAILDNWMVKRLTKPLRARAMNLLLAEVGEYNSYLAGDVWGYVVEDDGKQIDACWGFIGEDAVKEAGEEALKAAQKEAEGKLPELCFVKKSENEFELTGLVPTSSTKGHNWCWVTVGKVSLCIKKTDEGVLVDMYPVNKEDEDACASAYVYDNECGDEE